MRCYLIGRQRRVHNYWKNRRANSKRMNALIFVVSQLGCCCSDRTDVRHAVPPVSTSDRTICGFFVSYVVATNNNKHWNKVCGHDDIFLESERKPKHCLRVTNHNNVPNC